jgi:anti-anti-sigma factor
MELVVLDDGAAGPLRLAIKGRLDAVGTAAVEQGLLAALSDAGRDVMVDISGVGFVGSLGIRMLIAAARQSARHGARMVLVAPQPSVGDVFAAVALDDLLPVVADPPAALAVFQG